MTESTTTESTTEEITIPVERTTPPPPEPPPVPVSYIRLDSLGEYYPTYAVCRTGDGKLIAYYLGTVGDKPQASLERWGDIHALHEMVLLLEADPSAQYDEEDADDTPLAFGVWTMDGPNLQLDLPCGDTSWWDMRRFKVFLRALDGLEPVAAVVHDAPYRFEL